MSRSYEPAEGSSQRVLSAGFCHPLRDAALAHRAQSPEAWVLARGSWVQVSAAGRRGLPLLLREAFLRGISTRQVGRVAGILTGEVVSAQTVSQLTRDLDQAVRQFHQAPLADEWAYLFLDGVSLRVRRTERPAAGADAGGLRRAPRWHAATAGVSCAARARARALGKGCSGGSVSARAAEARNFLLIVTDGCDCNWRRRSRRSTRGCCINAAGCIKCATFWSTCASATMMQ